MRELVLHKKTGFMVVNPQVPINIRDPRGIMFYTTEPLVPKVTKFNLPSGKYFVDTGQFREMKKPVKYKLNAMPKSERFFKPLPNKFTIEFRKNPNKCTIYWDMKKIVFDPSLQNLSVPEIMFILYHEYGHSKFGTEKYADLFAANYMKKMGYNPSQIGMAPITSLSELSNERKEHIVDRLIKVS